MGNKTMENRMKSCCSFLSDNKYAVYVLTVLMLVYMVNQLNTFCLIATNTSMSQQMEYGDRQCSSADNEAVYEYMELFNTTGNMTGTADQYCIENSAFCDNGFTYQNATLCYWEYLGKGLEYQLLAGPLYIILFSVSGIPLAMIAELNNINRKVVLFLCILMWSAMTIFGGLCKEYWQVAITRLLLGIFSAGCVPFCGSIISDYFTMETRGAALGFFNWGVYVGYSLTFVLTIAEAKLGWEAVYFIAGAPGIALALLEVTTIKEPKRSGENEQVLKQLSGMWSKLKTALIAFSDPCLLLLCLGGAIRNGAGIVFAYNIIIFFDEYHPGVDTAKWMSWIPLVFGSIGAFGGGYLSDKLAGSKGVIGRLLVLIFCLIFSAPFLVGTLYAPMPWCWVCHSIAYVIGEMWIGVCVAVVIDMVPTDLTTSSIAVYFFIIQIIGGNMNLLVPPIEKALDSLQLALLITFPGMYILAALFFIVTLLIYRQREKDGKYEKTAVTDDLQYYTSKKELSSDGVMPNDDSDIVFQNGEKYAISDQDEHLEGFDTKL